MYCHKEYNNAAELVLTNQIMFCFGACVAMTDRSLDSTYKYINFGVCVTIGYSCGVFALLHPFFLRILKNSKQQNTGDCYLKSRRSCRQSENYVLCDVIVRLAVSISIPFLPVWATLALVTFICAIAIWSLHVASFSAMVFKVLRGAYLCVLAAMNIAMLALYTAGKDLSAESRVAVGYVCIGLILVNILIEVLEVLVDLGKWLAAKFLACKALWSSKLAPVKHKKKIRKMKRQVQLPPP